MATDKDREYLGEVGVRQASFLYTPAPGTVNTRTGGDRDIRDRAGPARLADGLANSHSAQAQSLPGARGQIFKRPACAMVAQGDADALNLRHIRRHRGHFFLVVAAMCPGAEPERAVTRRTEGSLCHRRELSTMYQPRRPWY